MTAIEAAALRPAELVQALRSGAQTDNRVEAAVELLIRHNVWIRRPVFLATCVQVTARDIDGVERLAATVDWHKAARLAERVATTSTDRRVLRVAAALGGRPRRVDIVARHDGWMGIGAESVDRLHGIGDGRPG